MQHNRMPTYLLAAAAVAVALVIAGIPLAVLLPYALLLACPLMMILMMRGMGATHSGSQDHTGHGREHDPTGPSHPPATNGNRRRARVRGQR
jgi:Protein of unknown function (DUF2933)